MGTEFIYTLSSLHSVINCTVHKTEQLLNLVPFISALWYNNNQDERFFFISSLQVLTIYSTYI